MTSNISNVGRMTQKLQLECVGVFVVTQTYILTQCLSVYDLFTNSV